MAIVCWCWCWCAHVYMRVCRLTSSPSRLWTTSYYHYIWMERKLYPRELIQLLITLLQTCRLIENEYLGLKNGILDQSAILLSSYGCLTCMDCKVCILYLYFLIFRMAIFKLHVCFSLFFIVTLNVLSFPLAIMAHYKNLIHYQLNWYVLTGLFFI